MSETQLVVTYQITDERIAEIEAEAAAIVVRDGNDDAGFGVARHARLAVRATRGDVERTRVALKKDALEYGRAVDAEARRIRTRLEAVEARLQAQEQIVLDERERVAEEKAEAERVELKRRVTLFEELGAVAPVLLASMDDAALEAELVLAREQKRDRDAKAAKEAAEAAAEQKRIQEQREADWKRQQAEQARIREEAKLAEERREAREAEYAKARAAIAAEREEIRKAKEELEAEKAKKAEAEAAAKAKAAKPAPKAEESSAPKWTPSERLCRDIGEAVAASHLVGPVGLAQAIAEQVWAESPGPALYEALEGAHRYLDDALRAGCLANGVTAPCSDIDEGEVHAQDFIQGIEAALALARGEVKP